jgi:hypothetical protein
MAANGDGSVELVNSGNVADELLSVSIVGFAPATPTNVASNFVVTPNGNSMNADFHIAGTFDQGQTVTVKLVMKSGAQLTQSIIVTA